mmetsp:Transcript_42916/g.113644  ORF Transcript_42916/g.113644 Transcript_42916/m.113644 type:complete len:242 (-) Transcript_42916:2021-2746(-)
MSQLVHSLTTQSTVLLQASASRREALQPTPVTEGSCSTSRERYIISSSSQEVQLPQAPRMQSFRSSLHGLSWQLAISSREPPHGFPPPRAWAISRARVLRPPPHSSEQSVHLDHAESAQSATRGSPSEQDEVSLTAPPQGLPPFAASCLTLRVRIRWSFPSEQSSGCHFSQASNSQSTGAEQSFSHSFVSVMAPSQGVPLQSDSWSILRWRVQSCSQVGWDQFPQRESLQSRGMHSSWHGL